MSKTRQNYFSGLMITIGSLLSGIGFGAVLSTFGLTLEGGAVAVVAVGPLFWLLDRHLNPTMLIGPASYAYLYHLLGYALGPLGQRYLSVNGELFRERGMVLAQWGAVLGLLAFALTYAGAFRLGAKIFRPWSSSELDPTDRRWTGYTILLVFAAIAITVYAHATNAFRRLGQFETPTVEVQTAASAFSAVQQVVFMFLAFVAARQRSTKLFVLWFLAIAGHSTYTFLEGTRGLTLVAVILSAIGFLFGGISKKIVLGSLVVFVMLFVPVSAIVVQYRSTPAYSSRYDEGFGARVGAFSSAATELQDQSQEGRTSALDIFWQAVTAVTVDRIMEYTPDRVPFAGFRDLERVFAVWRPKVIDPDRPSLAEGNEIAREYGTGHDGVKSWVYTPTVGEGYRRFGWVGIPLVYGFVGLIFGGLTGICWARRRQREWAAMLAFCFLAAPGAWSSTVLSAVRHLAWNFPKFLVLFYLLRRLQDSFLSFGLRTNTQRLPANVKSVAP